MADFAGLPWSYSGKPTPSPEPSLSAQPGYAPESAAPRFELRRLRGANPFSRDSVLVGDAPEELQAEAAAPDSLLLTARQLGLPDPVGLEAQSSIARSIESLSESIRTHLGLPPVDIDRAGLPPDRFVVAMDPEELSGAIVELAAEIATGRPLSRLQQLQARIQATRDRIYPHVHMNALGNECRRRGIPWRRLSWSPRLHQIGEGSRQCRLDLTITSRTGRLATGIAGDKAETNALLARFGLPVPRQLPAMSPYEGWEAAQRIGLPVVVKPRMGNKGTGVSVNLTSREEVGRAVQQALQHSRTALVESYIKGVDHRVLIAGDRIIAVAKRIPAHVVGDGRHTVRELVDIENANPERSVEHKLTLLKTIEFDSEMERRLSAHGYTLDSVPRQGETIFLRFGGNLSTGATAVDLTDEIHPENADMLIRATRLVGLDIAGIDFLTDDVTKPYHENGAGICEVNSRIATRAHMAAELGTGKSVVARLLDAIYSDDRQGRVPTVLIYDVDGLADILAERIAGDATLRVGVASPDRVAVAGRALKVLPPTLWDAHRLLTEDPTVDFIILEVKPERVEQDGLGISHADLIIVPEPSNHGSSPPASAHMDVLQRAASTIVRVGDMDRILAALRAAV